MQGHQGDTEEVMATRFIAYVGEHYDEIMHKIRMLCGRNKQKFDQDALQEAIIRCHTAIERKGTMADPSPRGMEGYLIRSYINYVNEMKRACVNSKRDLNVTSDDVPSLYEGWYNGTKDDSRTKVIHDLYTDFATLYVMQYVEDNFDQEHFHLFKMKSLMPDMTYKKLSEMTRVKGAKQKVLEVKNHVKDNLTREEINNAFHKIYGDIL